jgi:hypothetical protein
MTHNMLIVFLIGVVKAAPLEEDEAPRGVSFDNETLVKEQLAENERLTNETKHANYFSTCTLNGVFQMPVCYQICDEWCWAATTTMMIQAYTRTNYCAGYECQLPSREFGRQCCPYTNSCRNSPQDPQTACNSPGSTSNIVDAATSFSGVRHRATGPLDQQSLDNILSSGHPVIIAVQWTRGGGHALLIGGCGSGRYYLHDPWGWYQQGGISWQTLSYAQLLQYAAPNGAVGRWVASVTASGSLQNGSTVVVPFSNSNEMVV